jgi:hypothetical protein
MYTYPIVHEISHHMHANDGDFAFNSRQLQQPVIASLDMIDREREFRANERAELERIAAKPYRHIAVTMDDTNVREGGDNSGY